jgi:isoleucyl-tRNA synthetase
MEQDKINAYMTLYTALVTISKAAAPMIPFMTEDIYRNLVCSVDASAPESIHLCDYPVCDESKVDKELEKNMELVLEAVVIGRACRNEANTKQRQPLSKMYVKSGNVLDDFYQDIIKDELNVKAIEFTDDVSNFTNYTFKPQLKTLGRRFGSRLNALKEVLAGLDGSKAFAELNEKGSITVDVAGESEVLEKDDLLVEAAKREGFVSGEDNGITVVLDTNLTPELIEEGFVRELISKVQTMRKDAGFEVMDRITVYVSGNDRIKEVAEKNADAIKKVVLADEIVYNTTEGSVKDWNLNGEDVTLGVKKN